MTMISDNASTYLSAASEIEWMINSAEVKDSLKNKGTPESLFQREPPGAPHQLN